VFSFGIDEKQMRKLDPGKELTDSLFSGKVRVKLFVLLWKSANEDETRGGSEDGKEMAAGCYGFL
jgi:hypothetical protein